MTVYKSGEFSPPGINQFGAPPAAGIYQDTLIVFGGTNLGVHGYPKMTQMTLNLSDLTWGTQTPPAGSEPLNTEALTNVSGSNTPWASTDMVLTEGQSTATPYTLARCGAASMQSGVYGFWNYWIGGTIGGPNNSSSEFVASLYNGTWGPQIKLFEQDGKTQPVPYLNVQGSWPNSYVAGTADVSATAFGSKIIVAIAQASSATCTEGGIFLAVYDPTTIDSTLNTWTADWSAYIAVSQLNQIGIGISQGGNTGTKISIDWVSMCPATNQPLQYFLAISFQPQLNGPEAVNGAVMYPMINLSTTAAGAQSVSIQVPPIGTEMCMYGLLNAPPETGTVFADSIVRDPAGRLRAYVFDASWAGYLMTTNPPYPEDPLPWAPTIDTFTTSKVNFGPTGLFYVFTNGLSNNYPVYEFVFYNECQVNRCGTVQLTPNTNPYTFTPETVSVVVGMIDGPIPLPVQNYPTSGTQADGGDLTYGNNTTTTQQRELDDSWTIGFQSSLQATTGVGVAANIAFNHGMGTVTGSTSGTCASYPLTQEANVTWDGDTPSVNQNGTLRTVSTQMNITAYTYLDENGVPVSDATTADAGQASKLITILSSFYNDGALFYEPYVVEPGNLESYKPDAWNKKMAKVSPNYYGEVICTNAYPFQGASQPYLEFTWTNNAVSSPSFTNFSSAYTESIWSLQDSVYLGVSGGGGLDVFGIGEDNLMSVLFGVTINQQSTTTNNTQSQWGIKLPGAWGPPNSTDPQAVSRYVFRLFFLPVPTGPTPPSNYWTTELLDNLSNKVLQGHTIDPNSCCWRIVYAVTEIDYVNGTTWQYDGKHDLPSTYTPPVQPSQ